MMNKLLDFLMDRQNFAVVYSVGLILLIWFLASYVF